MLYKCLTADPPWLERGAGQIKRGADRHFDLMGKEDIAHVMAGWMGLTPWGGGPLPGCKIDVEGGCHIWIWSTDSFLLDALWIMSTLGFRYVRTLQWVKLRDNLCCENSPVLEEARDSLQIGLGQYLRGSHEMALLGVRGPAMVPPTEKRLPSVVFAERNKHSRKPDEAIQVFESVSPGPRLEMFARAARPGWSCVGDEVTA